MKSLNREFAACVLVDALYSTDANTAEQYGISMRTIQRWRKRLADGDLELSQSVGTKRTQRDAAWAQELTGALVTGLKTLQNCFLAVGNDDESLKSPDMIHAVAGALKIVAEAKLTQAIIEDRLTAFRGIESSSRLPAVSSYRN
jgi:hypothetical protein